MATYAAGLKIRKASQGLATAEQWTAITPALLVLVAAVIPYIASLRYGFVYDDDGQILGPVPIHSWSSVPAYFLKPIPGVYVRYYRPVFFLWLRLNYSLWHTHPWGWHLTSLLLHAGVCLLVLAVLRRYFNDVRCAVAGALVFAVHPAHVESVVWVSGCTDALMAMGMLGSLLLWMKHREAPSVSLRIGSFACCAMALWSKETAVILPAVIWLHAFAGDSSGNIETEPARDRVSPAWEGVPYAGLVAVHLMVRHVVLRGMPGSPDWISSKQMVLTIPSLLLFYVRHLIWPVASSLFYDFVPVSRMVSPLFWVPTAVLAVSAAGIFLWFRRSRDSRVLLASLWFLLPIIPVLNIRLFEPDDFVHDRYLYVSVLALAVAAGLLSEFLSKSEASETSTLPLTLISVLIVSLALATVVQAQVWKSNLSLYKNAVEVAPENSIAGDNLASEYCAESRYEDAAAALGELLKYHASMWRANFNYGYVNYRIGNFVLADLYLHRAIQINPRDPDEYFYLGTTYYREGRLQAATEELRQAIDRKSDGVGYHVVLGLVLMKQGSFAPARQELLTEIKYHPQSSTARDALTALGKQTARLPH